MLSMISKKFSPKARLYAANIACEQGGLPESPGRIENESPGLCAAACLAAGHIADKHGASEAECFARQLVLTQDKSRVVAAFEDAGVKASVCEAVMIANDRTEPCRRVSWFIEGVS